MKSKVDEMSKKNTAVTVKQRMRKIAHNTVAVLVTLSLVWWQTPVYAMADEGTSPQSPAAAEVQSGEKTGGTTQETPQANAAADKPASEDEPGSSDLAEKGVAQPEAGKQEQAGAEKQEATAQEQEQAKDEKASQDKATAATEDKGQAEAEKKQEEAEPQKEPAVWTIKFDANATDTTGTADALENVTEDKDTVKLPKEPYKREGYKFLGWNTARDPKAPGVEPKDALFVPDEAQLYNLSYNYVVLTKDNATEDELKAAIQTTDGKLITIVGDDAKERGTDDKGRKVETCDLQALLKDKALTLYAQWEKIPDEKAEGKADEGKVNENPEEAGEKVGSDGTGVVESDDIIVTADGSDENQEELDPLATSDIFRTDSGFNTVNADGTITDADGYKWLIAPDDELDEEAAEGEGNGDGAAADAEGNHNEAAAEGDKANAGDADKKENPGEVKDSAAGDAEATAALDKAVKNRDALENGTGVKLFGLRLLGADPVNVAELPQEGDGSKIEAIRVKWLTPDTTGSAYVSEADRLSLVPGNDSAQAMKFQVEFALSGQYDYNPGDVQFKIPATIWKDHNGNPVGYMTLSVPEAPETGAEFAYRLVDGEYIITNTHRLPAASKAAFQFTIRGITPHTVFDAVFPVENYPGGEAGAIADGKTIVNGNVVDANVSAAIQPTITVTTHEGNTISLTTPNAIDATIDTSERITRATKSGELFENTPSNLPSSLLQNLPAGTAGDYLYVRWQTYCYHNGNQVFTLNVNDGLQGAYEVVTSGGSSTNVPFDDGGVILGGLNTSGRTVGTVSEDGKSIDFGTVFGPDYHSDTSYLYDHLHYVWSAYPKYEQNEDGSFKVDDEGNKIERFKHGHVYVFQNQADWSLTGADDNITTHANPKADGMVRYAPQKFIAPIGDYATHKWTESIYKDYTYGYYLDQLRAGGSVTMNYRVQTSGHTLSWTLGKDEQGNFLDPEKQENYGKRAVRFETYDDNTYFNYDWETPLTHEDFKFDSIRFSTPSMSNYGKFANGSWGYMNTSDATLKPDIEVYGQVAESGEWVHFATVSWNGNTQAYNGATVSGTTVTFPENVTDVKHVFETTAAAVSVDAYPVIKLKASPRVVQLVKQLFAESEFPVSKFQNNTHMDVSWPDDGTAIGSMRDQSRATLTGTTLAISSDKSVRFDPKVDNDTVRHRVTLHYTAKVYEQTNIESRAQYDDAVAAGIIPAETSGTWYDLLPLGVVPNLDSVKLRNGDAVKRVYTVENYKESGRTLMVVEADLKPQPTTISRKYADIPQLTFDAWYSWENVRDLGLTLVNRVAFESGTEGTYGSTVVNGQFGNIKDHMGEKDDPTGKNGYMNNQTKSAVGNDAEILKDLDPNTDKGGFVYAKCVYSIDPDLETRVSLIKDVMDDSKGRWTSGLKDREQVTVYPGHPYTYRLRVEADSTSATKGIILYDSLENYVPTYDKTGEELDDYGHPQWRGIFRSVDLTQLEQEGIAPVVYYATEDHLAFEDSNDGSTSPVAIDELSMDSLFGHYDISNTAIWSTTPPADLASITAIAIDCSKKTDGSDFILGTYVDENDNYVTSTNSISALVHMVAPVDEEVLYGNETGIGTETWATGGSNAVFAEGDDKYNPENNRYAYNNTRLVCTQGPGGLFDNSSTRQMIRNDYTRVGILPYELVINKLWNDYNNNDGKRPESVTVNLQASWYETDGTEHTGPAEYADSSKGEVGPIVITPGEDGSWTAKVERIKYVNDATQYVPLQYSLTEDEVAGYRFSAQQGNRDVNGRLVGNEENYFTVVNTHDLEKTSLSGKKDWNDKENEAGVRPGSIKVNLLADGKVVQTKTVTKGDRGDWSYSFGKLNKYARTLVTDEDGTQHYETHEIVYSVTEEYIPKYSLNEDESAATITETNPSFLLVNDYNPKGDLAIQKKLVNATDTAADKDFEFTVLLTREKANPNDEDMPVDGEFTYEVVDAATGDPVKVAPEGGGEPVALTGTVQSGGTIKIKGGQRAIIKDLPSESTYKIVETRLDGFVQTSSQNTEGAVRSGQVVTAGFENTYSSEGNVQLKAVKQLTGHKLARYQFRFLLYPDVDGQPDLSGNPIRTITNDDPNEDGTGPVSFGALRYTHADDGKDFTYYMVEGNTGKPGYTYDTAMYKVVVHVADNGDGTLTCTPTYYREGKEGEDEWVPLKSESPIVDAGDAGGETGDDASAAVPVFHNTYHAKGELTLRAWKTLTGRDLSENEFTFQLRDGDTGQVVSLDLAAGQEGKYNIIGKDAVLPDGHTATEQVKKNTKDGTIQFDPIVWDETALMEVNKETGEVTYLDKKEFLFTVNEVVGNRPEVNYDSSFKGYLVTVFDNGDGTLSIAQGNVDVSGLYLNCEACGGRGWSYCGICAGTGYRQINITNTHWSVWKTNASSVVCHSCAGSGMLYGDVCADCMGTGSSYICREYLSRGGKIDDPIPGVAKYLYSENLKVWYPDPENDPEYFVFLELRSDDAACEEEHTNHEAIPNTNICEDCEGAGLVRNPDWTMPDTDAGLPLFTNTLKPGSLLVTKIAEGENTNPEQEFNFRVELIGSGIEDGTISYEITKAATSGKANAPTTKRGVAAADKAEEVADEAVETGEAIDAGSDDTVGAEGAEEPAGDIPEASAEGTGDANANDAATETNAAEASDQDAGINPIAALLAPEKAYAAEGDSNPAYAILDSSTGELIFFRSATSYTNGRTDTVTINGVSHRGRIYADVENTSTNENTPPPWQTTSYNNTTIKSVRVAEGQMIRPRSCANWFRGCSNLTSFNATGFDTSNVVNMAYMFCYCTSLNNLDLSAFETPSLQVMNSMFNNATGLQTLNVASFDTSKVTNMGHLFTKCKSLTNLDLSNWHVEKVQYTDVMFSDCSSLTSLNIADWRLLSADNISNMFSGCSSLTSLDVSGWNVSSAKRMNDMFLGCSSLTKLDLSSWNTSNVRNMNGMFENCSSLEELNIYGFDTSKLTASNTSRSNYNSWNGRYYYPETGGTYKMFSGTKLKKITLGPNFSFTNKGNSGLPDATGANPVNEWMNETNPYVNNMTATQLMSGYVGGTMEGTWVWATPATTYSLRFDINNSDPDASGSISDQKNLPVGVDSQIDPVGSFMQYGRHVTGWNTKADGTGTAYDYNGIINIAEASYIPVILYAQWANDDNNAAIQNGTFEFSMRAGYTATFPNLPAGTAYRVYEETPTGWILVSQQNTSGSIPALGTAEAKFTNKYEPGSAQVQPFATKTLDGQPAANGRFTFELRDADGNLVESVSNSAGGFVQFSPITYEQDKFEDGDTALTYYITEVEGSDETVAYDTHQEKVTVTVTKTLVDNVYEMTAQLAYDPEDGSPGVAAFNNTSVPGELALTKNTTNSSSDPDAEFEFTIQFTNKYGQGVDASSVQWYKTGASGETTDAGSGSESTGDQGAGDGQGGDSGDQNADNPTPGNGDSGDEGGKAADQPANGKDAGDKGSADEPAANPQNGPANLFSFLAPEKAYADEETVRGYAVFNQDTKELILFNSSETYDSGASGGPFVDVSGNEYYGTVYSNLGGWPKTVESVRVAEGQTVKAADIHVWFDSCSKLVSADLRGLDTSSVEQMYNLFCWCGALEEVDLSTLDTSSATGMSHMFESAKSLKSLDLSNFNTSKVRYMGEMFHNSGLEELDISSFDVSKVEQMGGMFGGANDLKKIKLGPKWSFRGNGSARPAELPTPRGDVYTGNWVNEDKPNLSYSPSALINAYDTDRVGMAGTWVWELKPTAYTVLLDPQGGTVPNERLYGITDSGVALPAAARPGWTFKGWNTEPDGSGTTFQAGNGRRVSNEGGSTTTLYAQWDVSSDVTYTARHHQETVAGGEYTIAETITGADVTDRTKLEPKDYAGFYLNSGKTTEVVSDDGTKVDIDYYYDRVRYTLAFDPNGGEGAMDSLQLVGGVSKQLPANAFSKSGNSSFVGWNTAANGSGTQYVDRAKVINLTKTSGKTVTLYAQWATLEKTPAEATSGLFKIKLKAGETAHFTNLPAGTTYEIVESNVPAGWKQTGSDGLTGAIPAAGSAVASVTNTYDANGFVALEAHKQLEGLAAESGQFSFKLVDSKGQVQQTTNGAIDEAEEVVDYYENEGTPEESAVMKPNPFLGTAPVRFGDIDYTLAGVLADVKSGAAVANEDGTWTYTYTITEVANEDDKLIQYDGTTVTATVTLRDDGKGKLIPTVAYHYGDAEGNTFVNTVHPGSLSVTKQVANGTQANGGAKFPFTITLVDKVGNALANKTYAASGVEGIGSVSTDANGVAAFELAGGETLLIEGLPDGATYTVAEVESQAADNEAGEGADGDDPTGADEPAASPSMPAGFSNTGKEGDQGVIKAQETSEASFVNTYDAEGIATIGAFKMLTDKNLKDVDPFTFELRNANGDVIQSANNDTEGNVSFAPIEYSLAQILRDVESEAATQVVGEDGSQSWVYQYTVDEYLPAGAEDSPIDGIYYDAHVADVTVTITDNGDGTLSTVVAYPRTVETEDAEGNPITETVFDAIAEFMNTYDDNSVNARFEVQKRFAQATTDTEFEFEMQPVMMGEDNKPVIGDNGLPVVDPSAEPVKATASGFESGSAKATFELGQFFKDGDHYYLVHEATASEGSMLADPTYYLAYVQVKRAAVQPTVFKAYYPVDQKASAYEVMEEGVDKAVFYNNDNARLCFRPLTMAGYTEAAERVSVYPQVRKVLDSPTGILVGGDFSFELATGEGAVIATVANDENGKVAFFREDAGELGLVYEEPGVHEYAIREVIPENATDNGDGTFSIGTTTYDGSTIGLTVTVQEVNGALVAEEVYHDAQGNVIEDPAFVNSQEGIDLVVYKVSRFGGEGLDQCTYALWMVSPNGDVMLAEGTSDATGRIVFPDVTLTSGTKYYFKEVEAPSGHTVDPYRTAYFTLNEAGDGTVLVEETADDGWHSKYDNIGLDQERSNAGANEVPQEAAPIKEGN